MRALGFEGNEMDTTQKEGATACNDRAPKNQTPVQGYPAPSVTSTGDATDDGADAAQTASTSQSTTDKANGKNGAHVAAEGEQDPETQEGAPPVPPVPKDENEQAPKPAAVKSNREKAAKPRHTWVQRRHEAGARHRGSGDLRRQAPRLACLDWHPLEARRGRVADGT